jgi:DNA-binding response OmpR family regulator
MKGKVLIVDDEAKMRKSLREILELEGYQVADAQDGTSALSQLDQAAFDLIMLDLKMPGMDGLEVMAQVRATNIDTRIIMLTAHGSLDSAIHALRQGAYDYILKPSPPNEILASVSRAMGEKSDTDRKRQLLSQIEASLQELKDAEGVENIPEVVRAVYTLDTGVKIDLERREIWQDDVKISLTPTEGKLMKVLIENRGRVLSHRELVLQVQGYQTTDWEAPEIMRPLVSRLRRKLSPFTDNEQWIVNVRGTGYVFEAV